MINVEQIISEHFPSLSNKPAVYGRTLSRVLRLILREKDFSAFAAEYPHLQGTDFIEQVLTYFDFGYSVRLNERERIPSSGPAVIISNHPIGSLDGLALLRLVNEIRPDVKVVANTLLQKIEPLHSLLLPVNNMQGGTSAKEIKAIHQFVRDGGAIIIFPAGEVSRLGPKGVKDGKWNSGFLRIARSARAPIVPVWINGKNSPLFYGMSVFCKPLSTLWLVREMFNQKNRAIQIRIGEPIGFETYQNLPLPNKDKVNLFRKHLYRIGRGKKQLFKTEKAIALPESRDRLRNLVRQGEALGTTRDGKEIYLHEYAPDSSIMREIGRLRELSFRSVGEGCGKRRDVDRYDISYQHMVLWDDDELEIVGAYRWRNTCNLEIRKESTKALYSSELFELDPCFASVLSQGLELGRSFVQPRYWGKRSLDYLWQGIGAYLRKHPEIRYLFGPVSISQNYSPRALAMLAYFYSVHFPPKSTYATARLPYRIDSETWVQMSQLFSAKSYNENFRVLKEQLMQMGHAIPTLYKQYSELCEQEGVQFIDFNIDPNFANCIDGLVLVDLHKIKPAKFQRYIGEYETAVSEKVSNNG